MSVQRILYNYAHGLPITGAKVPIYELNENGEGISMPDLARMDLSEIHDLAEENRNRIQKLQDELRKGQTQKAAEEYREKIIKELETAGWKKSEDTNKVIPPTNAEGKEA